MKSQPKANNNREAVVVCASHVVKRPSKRMRASGILMLFDCSSENKFNLLAIEKRN